MKLKNHILIVNMRRCFRHGFFLVMLCSLANSYIFEFLDSTVNDSIEWAESDEESEIQEELVDKEFIGTSVVKAHRLVEKLTPFRVLFGSLGYVDMDIFTPPPDNN